MHELTETEALEYQSHSRDLADLRQGLEVSYRGKNWWRRNRHDLGNLVIGGECAVFVGCLVLFGLMFASHLAHPIPSARDYPYVIKSGEEGTSDSWFAKEYYEVPGGGIVVLNDDCMVKHDRIYDQGCYVLSETIPQLEFAPNTVIVKER